MTYNTLCDAVVRAGRETAISVECKCKGWYKASESILIPVIKEKTDYDTDYKKKAPSPTEKSPTSN